MRVWYAAYGSNLHAERLAHYVAGGVHRVSGRSHAGCRDRTAVVPGPASTVPWPLVFAGHSAGWGGAVAFLDPERTGAATPVRLWSLTVHQLADVVAQENVAPVGSVDIDVAALALHGRQEVLGQGWYRLVLQAGTHDGAPVLTATCASLSEIGPTGPPGEPYLRTIAAGYQEALGWAAATSARHLAAVEGAAGHWDPATLEGRLLADAGR